MKLKALALVPGIGCPTFGGSLQTEILLRTAFLRLFRDFVINQPITFHHMQSLGVRCPIDINHGKRSVSLDPNGVYHQGLALVVAHGVAMPGWASRVLHASRSCARGGPRDPRHKGS